MGDLVDPDAGAGQRPASRGGHGGGAPQFAVARHVRRILRVGSAAQVDPPILRDAQRIRLGGAGQHQRRCHVDVHDRRHQLRVRVGHHAVVRARRHDLAGGAGDGEPGVRAGCRDGRHGCQHPAQPVPVRVEIPAEVRPAGVVEQRERQIGLEHRVRDLGGVEVHVHREGALLRRTEGPLGLLAGLLEAPDGGQSLGAGDQRQVESAVPDLSGRRRWPTRGGRTRRCPSNAGAPVRRRCARTVGPRHRRTATTASRRRRCSGARRGRWRRRCRRRPHAPPVPTWRAARVRRRVRRRCARYGGRRR